MNRFSLLIGTFLSLTAVVRAQGEAFSLEQAKQYALEHHIDVVNAQLDMDDAKQRANEVRGIGLPQVSMNGNFNDFLNLPIQVIDASFFDPNAPDDALVSFQAGTKYSSQLNFQASQLLFNGSYIIGLKAASYFEKFQATATQLSKEDVLFNVIQMYQLASIAKENVRFVDSLTIFTQQLVDQQEVYYDLGMLLQEDMDQLNYSLLEAEQAKVTAQTQYQNTLYLLKYAMGYPVNDPIEVTETTDDLIVRRTIGEGDIHSNLSYQLMEKQIVLSELNLKNTKMANVPDLSAFYQQSYSAYRNEFDFFDSDQQWFLQSNWGLQLNIPIFSGGQRYAVTQQAKIRLMKDENSLTLLEQGLLVQEKQAKNNLQSAQAKNELQRENVELAKSIYANAAEKEKIGNGTSIIVTQKYNQLIVAQTQYINSLIDLFQAQLELDKIYNNILEK